MDEGYISKVALTAIVLWSVVTLLFAASWGVALAMPEHWLYAVLLAATACGFAVFTGTLHNRIYVERIARLIRACSQLDRLGSGTELHAVRDDTRHSR